MNTPNNSLLAATPERILCVLPTGLGDLAAATPFIRTLFAQFPQARIHMLMERRLLPLLEGSPWVDNAHFLATDLPPAAAGTARRELLVAMRAQHFDLAVVLSDGWPGAWFCWRVGARRRVGFGRGMRSLLLTDSVPGTDRGVRPAEDYAALARAVGMADPGDRPQLFLVDHADLAVEQRLASGGVRPEQPLVVLNPGVDAGACPPEQFAAVADHLVRRFGVAIVIAPGPGEELAAQAIGDAMAESNCLLAEPCLSLGELKSLVADADLLLGDDGARKPVGRAFDTPLVPVVDAFDTVVAACEAQLRQVL